MLQWNDVLGPSNANDALQLLAAIIAPNTQANLDVVLGRITGQPVQSVYQTDNTTNPRIYCGQSGGTLYVVIGPTSNLPLAVNLVTGYTLFARPITNSIRNPTIQSAATFTINLARNIGHFLGFGRTVIVGYSLGGAVGWEVAYQIEQATNFLPGVVTFGSPRPFGKNLCQALQGGQHARYMVYNDAVPLVPPRAGEMPTMFGVWPPVELLGFEYFCQPSGGLVFTPTQAPPVSLSIVSQTALPDVLDLGAWLFQQVTLLTTPHSLTNYLAYVAAWIAQAAARPVPPPASSPVEPANPPSRAETNRVARKQQALVYKQAEVQDAGPVVIPPTLAFTAYRVGSLWQVAFQGTLVATAPTKKKALGLKNVGNSLLARLSRQGVVDPANLGNLFTQYLQQAADPSSGVTPTINTQWPS